jgi:hypothetical protein
MKAKERVISPWHSIQRICESKGMPIPTLTMFYAGTNDMIMKVFECSNTAYARTFIGKKTHTFASELDMRMDPTLKVHYYEIPQFLQMLPALASKSLNESLKNFVNAYNKIREVNQYLIATWDEQHNDVYHTEVYFTTETYTDADGNMHTEQVMHTRQVYDYTIHTYTYHPNEGEKSSELLELFAAAYPELELEEKLLIPSQTGAENEYAIEKSREKELKQRLHPNQLLIMAQTWATGSTLMINMPGIINMIIGLNHDAPEFKNAKLTAHSERYKTYSSSDSGPIEFQVAKRTLEHGKNLEKLIGEIIDGILVVKNKTPDLGNEIKTLIKIEMDGIKGNAEKHKRNILSISREIYDTNFKNGFNVHPSRWWLTVFWSLFGTALGLGIGVGLDALLKLDFSKKIFSTILNWIKEK